ncbi:MAG TPA: MlaD family protein [Candidatus Acidoferrum sp.]|nr:MlaD family protein [Candidatus Acidoferrum sp.]
MAQRKLTWSELRVGVFVFVALVVVALGIFYVTGSAGFWVPKYTIRTYLPETDDLANGAPVNLDGVAIGNVQAIHLTQSPPSKQENVTVVMRVRGEYSRYIRTDSRASLLTQGVLGTRYVEITRGVAGSQIPSGGVVTGVEVPEISQIGQGANDMVQKLQVVAADLQVMVEKVNQGQGSLGKILNDPSLYNHLEAISAKADDMMSSIQQGKGTVGKFIASDELYNKADDTVTKVDDMMTAVQQQKGILGRAIYDPTMANDAKQAVHNANEMLAGVQQGKGSLGKFVKDDAVYNNLRDASANIRDATAKLNTNQGTLGKMFNDPALYDNMTGLTGDMQLLMSEFRKNPKKFLRIKLGIF